MYIYGGKHHDGNTWGGGLLTLPLNGCTTLRKLLNFSGPEFIYRMNILSSIIFKDIFSPNIFLINSRDLYNSF